MSRDAPIPRLVLLAAAAAATALLAVVTGSPGEVLAGAFATALGAALVRDRDGLRALRRPRAVRVEDLRRTRPAVAPGETAATPEAPAGISLTEDHVRVDREQRPRERVRLVKHVVVEHVTVTVPVRREELRVERIPLDGPAPPATGEVVQELTLMEDVPLVETTPVARERVVVGHAPAPASGDPA